ncbi:hydroxymethylglutaryl-CoA lyase [Actinoalloteichus hymeniacidonis]|uniref:Hydroxymethylglutaryl-CoA lyase n=1 Tax=Actinoalloteichus hymeniacidonis TaxID=340345 RepID=A0AAC9HUD1_9PSEU|nr:hydroxymethylglutaryl-CoA lyase [Actinoalloteichus hymeniacidonis]AOS65499.1 hydroxymethylglutaryl-CoA lyase [Actinoalloteichus hymeniacidonis]MBB5906414.1 hydroxymethylglutaryl-CoA lyase [Actinoalloteichus hymeniacidonis]
MTDFRALGLPQRVPAPEPGALPSRVTIWEVGPRDGLQNESTTLTLDVKLEFLRRLAAAGLSVLEATSFVSPRWVPQLADAAELIAALPQVPGVRYPVLVPNERGLDRALEAGIAEIAIFGSATESFARRNLNCGMAEQFAMFEPVVSRATSAGLRVRGYLSMCFGDPWEGTPDPASVAETGRRLLDLGCDQLSLGDTIGVATPGQVETLLKAFDEVGVGVDRLAVHFHDTFGQALSNTLAALRAGVSTVDSSAGGLGGCPYAESATGNLATEDLVWMLDGLGIEHGVDLDELVRTSVWMARQLGRPSASRVVTALGGS